MSTAGKGAVAVAALAVLGMLSIFADAYRRFHVPTEEGSGNWMTGAVIIAGIAVVVAVAVLRVGRDSPMRERH
jgi:sugar phosphate permease